MACGRECRGAVQLPHLRADADNSAAGADRAGEYPLWGLRHQSGLSGRNAGHPGLVGCVRHLWDAAAGGQRHGAYLRFLPGEPLHPIALGAAMCCDSAHKTLPVVTGGAYLHLAHDAPVQDEAAVRGALALFGSTSPSYLILQSLDACNAVLAGDYPRQLAQCCAALEGLRRSLNKAAAARQCPVPLAVAGAQQEPMKLTLDAAALGCTGTALAEALRRTQLECEYADPRYVVLMFTPENPPQDYTRLQTALEQLLAVVPAGLPRPENRAGEFAALQQQAVQRCTIRQAVLGAQVRIPVHKALGRVCAMPTVSCPPAIPVAVSGEEITPAAIALMQRYGIEELSVLR